MLKRLQYYFLKLIKPSMVGGFQPADGKQLKRVRISNTTHIGNKEKLTLGDNVFIGHFNMIDASNGIKIEEGCQLTNYISVLTHSSHIAIRLYGDSYTKQKNPIAYKRGNVEIGKYTFVGPHATIMPSTKIGRGSIISAYSYVKGEHDDFSILAGNPAKKIGDSRKIDLPFLEKHPQLRASYEAWAGKIDREALDEESKG